MVMFLFSPIDLSGEFVNEFGETVIDEEEFGYIKLLQDLKSRYRDDYEKWRDLKSEITYCTNMLEQCRQRLIQGELVLFVIILIIF
jgi:hypothetical protein